MWADFHLNVLIAKEDWFKLWNQKTDKNNWLKLTSLLNKTFLTSPLVADILDLEHTLHDLKTFWTMEKVYTTTWYKCI